MQNTPKLRVSLAGLRLILTNFLLFGRNVVTMMTGNLNYTTPFPLLADVTTALDDLAAKAEAALSRDRIAMAARNAAWATAISLLRQLAAYVQAHCQNDLTILVSSGFLPTKTPAPVGPLGAPLGSRLTRTGMGGQLLLRFQRVYGTLAGYTVQVGETPAGPYTDYIVASSTRVEIDGRTPMTTYWVRVRANGADGPGPWSEPVSAIAL
jgi:hypothetical protein